MTSDRDAYATNLQKRFEGGTLSSTDMARMLAEYDAFQAAKRSQLYAIISTAFAAVSAIASALSAYFAYLGIVAHH